MVNLWLHFSCVCSALTHCTLKIKPNIQLCYVEFGQKCIGYKITTDIHGTIAHSDYGTQYVSKIIPVIVLCFCSSHSGKFCSYSRKVESTDRNINQKKITQNKLKQCLQMNKKKKKKKDDQEQYLSPVVIHREQFWLQSMTAAGRKDPRYFNSIR